MKNYLLFKKYSTPKLLTILYWTGLIAIYPATGTLIHLYETTFSYNNDEYMVENNKWELDHEKHNMAQIEDGYIHDMSVTEDQLKSEWITQDEYDKEIKYLTEHYDQEMKWHAENILRIEERLSYHKNNLENESSDLLPFLIIFLALQIVWRVILEWWKRWFDFLNIEIKNQNESNIESNLIKDFGVLKAFITPSYYIILYYSIAIGLIGFLVHMCLNTTIPPKHMLELTLYVIVLEIILRAYFETRLVFFKFLKRR